MTSNSNIDEAVQKAVDNLFDILEQAIQQELLKARINELNKHIAWADENVGGITLSRQQLDDRIANLQKGLKENSDE